MQVREDVVTLAEERAEFVRFSGLSDAQFTTLNVFATPTFDPSIVDGYDALFVGGSSDASVLEPDTYPFVQSTEWLMHFVVEKRIPTFASCYGFQAAVVALGGTVLHDRPSMEMGTYPIILTDAARHDPLFRDMPNPFMAVSGHQLRASALPPGTTHLAGSEKCPYHAFKLDDAPFWAFQFHPEVDRTDLVARITRYQERYLDSSDVLVQIVETAEDTPYANSLLGAFVERVLR